MAKHVKSEPRTKVTDFYRSPRFWSILVTVLLLSTAVFTAVYYRLATVDLDVTDDWAQQSLRTQAINQFSAAIRAQYPTLPEDRVAIEAEKEWAKYQEQNKEALAQQQQAISNQFKDFFQYQTGTTETYNQTYILEMDPYYWWQQAENYANYGSVCEPGSPISEGGECIDKMRLAPVGTSERLNLHTWLEAMMIKIGRGFNDNLDTRTIVFFTPVLLAALAIIPAFFIGRKIIGNVGGFVAAMIIATHAILLNRTTAGFSDTDGYNFLLPLLLIWVVLEAFDAKRWWTRMSLAVLAGIIVGLFSFAWSGWWFFFFIVLVCVIAYMVYRIALIFRQHKSKSAYKDLIAPAAVFGVFFVVAAISVSALTAPSTFAFAFKAPFAYTQEIQAPTVTGDLNGWPNILTTVAELNIPSLDVIIASLGGKLLVVLAAFGLFVTFIDPRKLTWLTAGAAAAAFIYYYVLINKGLTLTPIAFMILFALPLIAAVIFIFYKQYNIDVRYATFIAGWLLATLFATTLGIRFLLLGIPAFAIAFGIAIGWLYHAISSLILSTMDNDDRPWIVQSIVAALLLLIVFNPAAAYSPLKTADAVSNQQAPGMNDAWWSAMTVLREQTPQDTIVTSWWDYGHWFRNIGNRSVTFDGGSQNPAQGHWVGKILLTNNEDEAIGILRMLDCGANTAYFTAHKHLDVVPAKALIDELVVLDRAQAQRRLGRTSIPQVDQQKILDNTHCTPPPAVFITSGDMIGKAGVWGHFGSWDFKKSVAYEYAQKYPQEEAIRKIQELNYTETEATSTYFTIQSFTSQAQGNYWISGWPGYLGSWHGCATRNVTVTCTIPPFGVAQTPEGTLAIEGVTFNASDPLQAQIQYAVYNNIRLGGTTDRPVRVALADYGTKNITTRTHNTQVGSIGLLIKKEPIGNSTAYSVLFADPTQIDSTFTQLYFLDGVFSEHFTKIMETSEMGGSKIILWNVTWPQ
jgi:dolichyl-phosphooligosaccharide-protein glycotransferase